jgi:DnaK suppressor protein
MDLLEEEALGTNGKPANESLTGDSSEGYFQEFNLELLERDGSTLREIEEALGRVDSGRYGMCEECEAWIARDRLKAVPHTRHCIDCKRQLEKHGD